MLILSNWRDCKGNVIINNEKIQSGGTISDIFRRGWRKRELDKEERIKNLFSEKEVHDVMIIINN